VISRILAGGYYLPLSIRLIRDMVNIVPNMNSQTSYKKMGAAMMGNTVAQLSAVVVLLAGIFLISDQCPMLPIAVEELLVILVFAGFAYASSQAKCTEKRKPPKKMQEFSTVKSRGRTTTHLPSRTSGIPSPNLEGSTENKDASKLHIAVRSGDFSAVEQMMKEMKESNSPPSVTCYGVLINAYAKCGQIDAMERWLLELCSAGVGKPNLICINIAISACAKAGEMVRAEKWLARMGDFCIKADAMSYNAVIDACARTGNVNRAEEWLEKMKLAGVEPNIITFSSVLHACAKAGDSKRAEAWFQRMQSASVEANVICYNAVIHACSKEGDLERAMSWIEKLGAVGLQSTVNTYSTVMDALAKAGMLKPLRHGSLA